MPLPLNIQPMVKLKKRFLAAVRKTWDVETVNEDAPIGDRAGKHPDNVFDIDDPAGQFRLIVSRDRKGSDEFLHVSASVINGSVMRAKHIWGLTETLCGIALHTPEAQVLTKGGALHLIFK